MKKLNLLFCLTLVSYLAQAQTELISYGAAWQYSDNTSEPAAQTGVQWFENTYNDAAWSTGNAQLGYGDNDETTLTASVNTIYCRHSFNVVDPSIFAGLTLNLVQDDGAVVYLNGVEVWRSNMPTGTITYGTFASSTSSDNELVITTIANSLQVGANVIAVEIHQRSATSSDLSFDFELIGNAPAIIPAGATWKYLDDGSDQGTAWTASAFNDASWSTGDAQLGYGDGDEVTVVDYGAFSFNKHITTYFRKDFTLTNAAAIQSLNVSLLRDDGAVVYINGQEVLRDNMPSGTISYTTASTVAVSGSDEDAFYDFQVCNDGLLVNGTNVIAVEIHQNTIVSSDISFDLELSDGGAITQEVTRGPYLQKGTPNSVVVRWRSRVPTSSILNYGTSPSNMNVQLTAPDCGTEHEIEITGLNPNTTYYYELAHDDGTYIGQTNQYFKTSPVAGTDQKIRAWVLGDCGTANNNQRNVRDAYYNYENSLPANDNHTDMVLLLGDNAYDDGTDVEYQSAIFENMYEDMLKRAVTWSCVGNHDGHTANPNNQTGPYFDIFTFPMAAEAGGLASGTEAYYSFDYGNVHFIVLESYITDRSTSGAMYTWCESDIQNTTQDWIVCLWHHPPYTKGSHDSDIEPNLFQMRQNFLPMLEDNGVDLVMCGHSHSYERSRFLNGHYGLSFSFDAADHTVGATGNLSGKEDLSETYVKSTNGVQAGEGAVYITAGSSGKTSGGSLNHPAMFTSLDNLGSCVLEVDTDTLRVKFLRETGVIDDYFTIIKGAYATDTLYWTTQPADTVISCGSILPTVTGQAAATSTCVTTGIAISYTDSIIAATCNDQYIRTWTAMDSCGNSISYAQTITLSDTTSPVINCNITIDTIIASGSTTIPDYTTMVTATDDCGVNSITQSPSAGTSIGQGSHTVTLVATDTCGNTANCAIGVEVTTMSEVTSVLNEGLKIYPNPSSGLFSIELPNEQVYYAAVYGVEGQLVLERELSGEKIYNINLEALPKGNYIIRIKNKTETVSRTVTLY